MSCQTIQLVTDLFSAYNSLLDRCCASASKLSPVPCVVPSIFSVYNEAIRAINYGTPCGKVFADAAYPDPGMPAQCLSPVWLIGCRNWIEHMTCSKITTVCYDFATLFPRYIISGVKESCYREVAYDTNLTNTTGVSARLIVTEELSVDDDMEINGVSYGGACCTPYSLPVGTRITGVVAAGASVRIVVVDNWGVYVGATGKVCWEEV